MVGFLVCDDRAGPRDELARSLRAQLAGLLQEWVPVRTLDRVDALAQVVADLDPELVVLGAGDEPARTLHQLHALLARSPQPAVLWADTDLDRCGQALAAGARGILPTPSLEPTTPGKAGLTVPTSTGQPRRAPPHAAGDQDAARRVGPVLTDRELDVLTAMSVGYGTDQIAARLALQPSTVKAHSRRLFARLGVRNRADAVAAGFRLGLLS